MRGVIMDEFAFDWRLGNHEQRFQEYLRGLQAAFHSVQGERDRLSKIVAGWNRDEELTRLRAAVDQCKEHSLQILSDTELEAIKFFKQRHYDSCGNGSTYQYQLTGTGIGTAIKIRCPICGKEEDVTDYDSW